MTISINSFSTNKTNRGEYPKESLSDITVSFDVSSNLAGSWTVEANLLFSPYGGGLGTSTTAVLAGMTVVGAKQAISTLSGIGSYSDSITISKDLLSDIGTYIVRLRVLPAPGSVGFSVIDSDPFFVVDLNGPDSDNNLTDLQKTNLDINQGEGGTGDSSFTVSFTNQTSQVIVHNLGKYPNIVFKDNSGIEYDVNVVYDSLNQCTVSWNDTMSGTITCN